MPNMQRNTAQNQLLLLKDVEDLGRSGDVVSVKPGFARNFLLPQKMAVVADKFTLRLQARLKEERAKQAVIDKADAENLAQTMDAMQFSIEVKVDQEGRMYGSVSAADIVKICAKEGIVIDKKSVVLAHALKEVGEHKILIRLKEGVTTSLHLTIVGDRVFAKKLPEPKVQQEALETESPEA